MSRRLKMLLLATVVLVVVLGVPALTQARVAAAVTRPKLSVAPVVGVPFTASGSSSPRRRLGPGPWSRSDCTRSRTAI